MRAYAAVLAADGRRLVPLASSAKAAQVLGERARRCGRRTCTSSSTRTDAEHGPADAWFRLGAGDVVLVDEAGMAGTLQLAAIVALATEAGAVGAAARRPGPARRVDAGGALRLLETEVGAARLDHLHRFADPDEAAATLQLRDGDPTALGFYQRRDRVRVRQPRRHARGGVRRLGRRRPRRAHLACWSPSPAPTSPP